MTPELELLLGVRGSDDPFRTDFRNFVDLVYRDILGYGDPGRVIFDVADWMQSLPPSEDGKMRGQVQCQRGLGKSVLAATLVCWLLYCNPNIKVAVVCSTIDFARRTVKLVRLMLGSHELLRPLVPREARDNALEDHRKDQLDNEDAFVCGARTRLDMDPSCKAFTVGGTYTGIHPDVIIADDVETPENSLTASKRSKLHERVREFEDLCTPGGCIMFMGTPQTEDSLYLRHLDRRYVLRKWPARHPDPADERRCQGVSPMLLLDLAQRRARPGDPTCPERFGEEELLVREAVEGPQRFALQYLLDPALADEERYPLKLRNLIVLDVPWDAAPTHVVWGGGTMPALGIDHCGLFGDTLHGAAAVGSEFVPYTRSIMFVDPAGGGRDAVGWAVCKGVKGTIYLHACGELAGRQGVDGTSDAVMRALARIADQHDVQTILVEEDMGDGMYARLLQPHTRRAVETRRSGRARKEQRILDVLGPITRAKRLVVSTEAAGCQEFTHQFSHLTADKGSLAHDDVLDAVAGACAEFQEEVRLDPAQAAEALRAQRAAEAAAEFERSWRRQARAGRTLGAGMVPRSPTLGAGMIPRGPTVKKPRPRGTRGWSRC